MALEHKNTEDTIESEMAKYHELKEIERENIKAELSANIEAIKEECKQVNESYVLEMNQSLENINLKKINETKAIEEDYKTQMNLLK